MMTSSTSKISVLGNDYELPPLQQLHLNDNNTSIQSVDSSVNKADTLPTTRAGDKKNPRRYIIWLYDGLDVDSLKALLESFLDINLIETISQIGDGVLY